MTDDPEYRREIRKEASQLASEGFSVIPLKKFEKRPPDGYRYSTSVLDIDEIPRSPLRWWGGVAIHPGRSGVWVLDVDGEAGVTSLRSLIEKHGDLPRTRTTKSGRTEGGYHLYFDATGESFKSSAFVLAPGLDVKGNAGHALVVCPPTLHKSGNSYSYLSRIRPVRAPEWLLERVRSIQPKEPEAFTTVPDGDSAAERIANDYGLPSCMTIGAPVNGHPDGRAIKGGHPVHGSTTGGNFSVYGNDTWFCWRCQTGGGRLALYAVVKGVVECSEVKNGWLKKHYREIINELEADGYSSRQKEEDLKLIAPLMAKFGGQA